LHSFIPPFILENMAKNGIEDARISILQSTQTTDKRTNGVVDITTLACASEPSASAPSKSACASIPPSGTASREVFDCQNKWTLRIKVVRGEGDPATGDEDVKKTYEYAGITRDFYKSVLGRNSIDNIGMNMILNVHVGANYMNAFWDGDEMAFGDGDGKIFVSFAKSLDVVSHELTHGITQFTANLEYKGQSGALNEHFSDVFGTAITQYANKETAESADWLIGDEIMGPTLYGEALRSMMAPGTAYDNDLMGKDPQPDHMKDYYKGHEDNYGVHINSGIPNRAFYLVAMDIGTDKAALIWYHALQNLWPSAKFNDAVKVITRSAQILIIDEKVPKGSTQSVRSAFKAVGLPTP
jgi:Zn-dependent metalloprotease